ncbi:transcription-repair coupling factor [Desulfopila aestuarii]|uniref:Transcription-repair-coupling factor n=1 Tax=Desulfopila aestuarii DSM 18488 TaxID=1121416 RepID=A0A1M7Y2U0_9BACT|nr:transcription-repair coupling factor [Desulfopila aestuarii]SHO46321.1 transcription-repair coupling factor [Desulfopila aestuarii DSM 18488]
MIQQLLTKLQQSSVTQVSGLRGASGAWLCGQLGKEVSCCCILPDEHLVSVFEQDLRLFTDSRVLVYPGYEIPPYTPLSPDQQTTAARLATLYQLRAHNERTIVVTSIEALLRKVIPIEVLSRAVELLMAGEECDRDDLLTRLTRLGYEQVSLVQSVGDVAVRGGILDLYPPPFVTGAGDVHDGPLRLDFFGDTIESLRIFDPISQRSSGELEEAILLPVHDVVIDRDEVTARRIARQFRHHAEELNWEEKEAARISERVATGRRFAGMEFFLPLFYHEEGKTISTVFDYLPQEMVMVMLEPEAISQSLQMVSERIHSNYHEAALAQQPALSPESIFVSTETINSQLASRKQLLFSDFSHDSGAQLSFSTTNHQLLKQEISLQRTSRGLIAPLSDRIKGWQEQDDLVVLCCRSGRHTKNLAELLTKHHHTITIAEPPLAIDSLTAERGSSLLLTNHELSHGFSLIDQRVHFLSESELFGEMRLGSKKKSKRQKGEPIRFAELQDGDIVVHRDHGLGYYQGLQTIDIQGITNDFMLIEYRDGDKLYLPVDRLNLISRYEGLSDKEPKIDKLGTQNWKITTAKVKEEVWKVAHELLDIYARREMQQGRSFSKPGPLFAELEESFPYDETPGQDKAITEVITDLISDQPMDRLVCGDVGYGKTEVAIRGTFKVVEDGLQVAVLVPTTVLAEQHTKTFRERLAGFPVTVECINRFRTPAEQRKTLAALKDGKIDILIGTHRLLSKDVVFKNLGLLIVDEEHRFGVAHKERIKKMRSEVDILTLTATPIPRTLQMSLLGIRDLSVISSPPEHRRPVKTFIARYDNLVIKEAVSRELRRKGQVFFIHNRVKSIHKIAGEIQKLVPEARVAIAHGQMAGKELEEIMVAFVNRDIDVLVCTTIVESGLDIPTANTIIINRADMLGLAEIYQLRGRVGRSSTQSFAYLLVPSIDSLKKDSRDRLRALMDCNELGGGFKLAMSDLQIRGGGNLLGISQSGHIAAIGYDLYLDLLQKTVADLKARALKGDLERPVDELDPEINLQVSAYIPEPYMMDISQRYVTYRRIAALVNGDETEHSDLQAELEDRYGPLPEETHNLFTVVALKKQLAALRINKLEKGRDTLVFTFVNDTPVTPEKLLNYVQGKAATRKGAKTKLTPDGRLVVSTLLPTPETVFGVARQILTDLTKMTHD